MHRQNKSNSEQNIHFYHRVFKYSSIEGDTTINYTKASSVIQQVLGNVKQMQYQVVSHHVKQKNCNFEYHQFLIGVRKEVKIYELRFLDYTPCRLELSP